MNFEWDEFKSRTNKSKHGIDFETAKGIFLDENRVEIIAPYPIEERFIIIGKINGKLWTVIFTTREGFIRIISARRSRKKEVKLYEKKDIG
ncbi:MAG: BrnT family toxin [Deltaproteobacteria bacterium]|nr:BrnT family toxin [Deltaproteobacteria bacterium]MCL5893216.1 BrnT family toxin [Deltaproteobacteria bacterium]